MTTENELEVLINPPNPINWPYFYSLTNKIFSAYLKKNYEDGLELSLQLLHSFPEVPEKTYFFTACFYALLEERKKALKYLEEGFSHGAWWPSFYLNNERDLEDLKADKKFIELGKKGDVKFEEEKKKARPQLLIRTPANYEKTNAYHCLLVLHWAAGNNFETESFWKDILTYRDDLFLAYLQSSQVWGRNMHVWNDKRRALLEIRHALEYLQQHHPFQKTILGGASQGANVALLAVATKMVKSNGLILVVPAFQTRKQIDEFLAGAFEVDSVATLIIAGKKDPLYQGALELTKKFQDEKIPLTFRPYPDLGHNYPPDFITIVNDFLATAL